MQTATASWSVLQDQQTPASLGCVMRAQLRRPGSSQRPEGCAVCTGGVDPSRRPASDLDWSDLYQTAFDEGYSCSKRVGDEILRARGYDKVCTSRNSTTVVMTNMLTTNMGSSRDGSIGKGRGGTTTKAVQNERQHK
ncbi:unnamed protein product [Symbiodinium microadriaticum]|nr:unnamed protein product [Symbiodinium microadriaticum]